MNLLYFLLLVGPLVLFHELGHFLMARRFGVRVDEFSIGMGPAVLAWRRGETQYSLRALPLGGYVLMNAGAMDPDDPTPSDGTALSDKKPWQRFLVHFGGPLMNLLLPIPILVAFLTVTDGRMPPVVGTVMPGSAADVAGLRAGDEVTAVDGKTVRFFDEMQKIVAASPEKPLTLTVLRDGQTLQVPITPARAVTRHPSVGIRVIEIGRIGVNLGRFAPVLDVPAGSVAHDAGLRTWDVVQRIDGRPVESWIDLEHLWPGGQTPVVVDVLRPVRTTDTWADVRIDTPVTVRIEPGPLAETGLRDARATVWSVTPGTPAARAGLLPNDRIVSVDGVPANDAAVLVEQLAASPDRPARIAVEREGQAVELTLTPELRRVVAEFRTERDVVFVGFEAGGSYVAPELRPMSVIERVEYGVVGGFAEVFGLIAAVVIGVFQLITGSIDTSALGGPIMIADVAARAGSAGFEPFLRMMAIVSVNLAILNLLPIPGLDGGHLSILAVETIKRGPLSFRARQIVTYAGYVSVVLLMLLAFKNDIERYWFDFANWINS